MKQPKRVLDLFCGAGGAAMGLHQAWPDAEIVGVDINPQPRYPFYFAQEDALTYPGTLDGFDFIWASPPCQGYSLTQRLRNYVHPRLIGETQTRLAAQPAPWVIENVHGAPLNVSIELCGAMFGLTTYRHRLFECSFKLVQPPHPKHEARTQKMGRPPREGEFMHVVGNYSGAAQARAAMGIGWMNRTELSEAIPPAYSRYIAEQWSAQA